MKILVVGDLHFPAHHKPTVRKILAAIKREQPTHILQIGDLYDQYCFSRFNTKNITTSIREIKSARACGDHFWRTVRALAPRAKCTQLLGNHDIRLLKRIQEKIPEAYEFVKTAANETLYTFEKVETIYDDRAEIYIGGINFHHGHRSRLGDHMRYNGESVVRGHSHCGGVIYEQRKGRILWELNVGHGADEKNEYLRYRPTDFSKWTTGYGLITWKDGVACPQFIPLPRK